MLVLLALFACEPEPGDPGPCAATWYADRDDDGFGDAAYVWRTCDWPGVVRWAQQSGDCDDTRADVHPLAEEVCDGVDQDCDGALDQDGPTLFADADGDGFGDPGQPSASCGAPAGAVADGTDCDDTRADVNPEGQETCDGADEDCDGSIDEERPTWYADADADGYGDPATASATCEAPAGSVSNRKDCDDAQAGTHPGATETCDGVDQDCDGRIDDSGRWSDGDGDGYGDASAALTVCDPGGVSNSEDCDDGDPAIHPGAAELCDGIDQNCNGGTDEFEYVDAYDDFDGDGYGNPHAYLGSIACFAFLGVHNSLDCDDLRASTHPGATETCDGSDEDCDGVIDDGFSTTWYADADGDGHGAGAALAAACEAPSGAVAAAGDCDDAAATVFPGAPELCDSVPNDCDAASAWTPAEEDGTASRQNADGTWEDLTASFAPGFHDAPGAGSTTWLCAGTHEGTFEVTADDVTIEGRYGADLTTLAWTTSAGDPTVAVWMASNLTLRGLTLTEGAATGTSAYTVPGIEAWYADGLFVEDCTLTGLRADQAAAGAEIGYGTAAFHRVRFVGNQTDSDGAAMRVSDARVDISESAFESNMAAGAGGALAVDGASAVTCTTCTFDDNSAASGGALAFPSGGAGKFTATDCDLGSATPNSPDDVAIGAMYSWTAAGTRTFTCDAAAGECR